ncbi:MAG TPA: hypothetical protein VK878_19770 [Candidatus Deferrimicrobiaceae bacterium]|nr:hypothetical protein [Candidatus Deferrimicrobiaceae bacterium]
MKRWMAGCLVLAVLLAVALAPGAADARGRFHRGGVHVGIWGPGLFVGGLALGAAIAAPYRYYPSYYPPYYYYPPDYYYAPPPTVIYQQAPTTYVAPAPVQREVVYPHGKYVLYGDGVTQAWQWVWVPNAPANPPPPPPTR